MAIVKKVWRLLFNPYRVVMLVCGLLTAFVFASSVETVFNKDLPVVAAVSKVSLAPVHRILETSGSVDQSDVGNYGKPLYLKTPSVGFKLILTPAIQDGDDYLARANSGHFALISKPKKGGIGDLAIYYRATWRTNSQPEQIAVGDNLFVDTDEDWRYFFRVTAMKTISGEDSYIATENVNSQLYLVAVEPGGQRTHVAQASLVNIQNVRL